MDQTSTSHSRAETLTATIDSNRVRPSLVKLLSTESGPNSGLTEARLFLGAERCGAATRKGITLGFRAAAQTPIPSFGARQSDLNDRYPGGELELMRWSTQSRGMSLVWGLASQA